MNLSRLPSGNGSLPAVAGKDPRFQKLVDSSGQIILGSTVLPRPDWFSAASPKRTLIELEPTETPARKLDSQVRLEAISA